VVTRATRPVAAWALWVVVSVIGGVLGALVLRALFIFGGAALIETFHWTIYLFGAVLLFTGVRMARHRGAEAHPERNAVLKLLRRVVPLTEGYEGQRFVVRRAGRRFATPLLAALIVVETTDLVFALDSIPAVFAVTTNTFLVFTSNAFAVLGLRALYFLFAQTIGRFAYLKLGLAAVLVFVGVKMILTDVYRVPIWASLTVIAALIGGSLVASLRHAGAPASSATERRGRGADLVDHGRGRSRDRRQRRSLGGGVVRRRARPAPGPPDPDSEGV